MRPMGDCGNCHLIQTIFHIHRYKRTQCCSNNSADKTDDIDQSADREIALPESLVKQTVLCSLTRQKRSQRDRSSDRY